MYLAQPLALELSAQAWWAHEGSLPMVSGMTQVSRAARLAATPVA